MGYSTKTLLRDAQGNPIPQYFDPVEDTFKPLENPSEISLSGSYTRLSTEPKPTASDGVVDGNDLLEVDTGRVFVFYKGVWREI